MQDEPAAAHRRRRIGEEILSIAKKPRPSGRTRTPAASVGEYLAALPQDVRAVGCSWA